MGRIVVALIWFAVSTISAAAEVLITDTEAALPERPDGPLAIQRERRGPGVEQTSPSSVATVHSPVALQIKFRARDNATIDPTRVRASYLKQTPVDLTERLRTHISADGITMPEAEIPPGTHLIQLEVVDSLGRTSTSVITLKIAE